MGTYSTRGLKGQLARSGGGPRIGFEGGQTPLTKRIPKKGFNRRKNIRSSVINVDLLNRFKKGEEVTIDRLKQEHFVGKRDRVKILGNGEIDAHKFSKSAKEKIGKAGGEIVKDA
jgi:large subunit ribosomal protein L15